MIIFILAMIIGLYFAPSVFLRRQRVFQTEVFTFDDGPSEISFDIAKILTRHNKKYIFFVLAEKINDQTKKTLHYIEDLGGEIGLHGLNHYHTFYENPFKRYKELNLALEIMKNNGFIVKYYRPCYGLYTLVDYIFIKKNNLTNLFWDDIYRDWEKPPVDELVEKLKNSKKKVHLLHDASEGTAVKDAYKNIKEVLTLYLEE